MPQYQHDDDNDFQPAAGPDSALYHLPPDAVKQMPGGGAQQLLKMPKRKKVPVIYYGTRTHKQVAQIGTFIL